LFRIRIDPAESGTGDAVQELKGANGVHGVALVPSKNVAFFSQGDDNTVGVIDPATLKLLGSIPVADDPDVGGGEKRGHFGG
jgi:YVTN family beta-propeller protein